MVFRHLNLLETAYFGLRYLDEDGQTVSDLHKTKSGVHLWLICMCAALVGSSEKTEQTAQGHRAIHALLWCKVLCCRPLQAPRGNHEVKPRALLSTSHLGVFRGPPPAWEQDMLMSFSAPSCRRRGPWGHLPTIHYTVLIHEAVKLPIIGGLRADLYPEIPNYVFV